MKIEKKFVVCPYCNKPFLAFEGILTKLEDQPCPYCYMTKYGKKWNPETKNFEN